MLSPLPFWWKVCKSCESKAVELICSLLSGLRDDFRHRFLSQVTWSSWKLQGSSVTNSGDAIIVGHAARDPVARPEARFFGPAQTRPGPVHFVPGLARPVSRARAWAGTPARGPARPGTELAGRPGRGPLTPTGGRSAQPSWPGEGAGSI